MNGTIFGAPVGSEPVRITDGVFFDNPAGANSTVPADTDYMDSSFDVMDGTNYLVIAALDAVDKTGLFEGAVVTGYRNSTQYQDLRIGASSAKAEYRWNGLATASVAVDWSSSQMHIVTAKFTSDVLRSASVDGGADSTETTSITKSGAVVTSFLGVQRPPSGSNPAASYRGNIREILVYAPIPDGATITEAIDYLTTKWMP